MGAPGDYTGVQHEGVEWEHWGLYGVQCSEMQSMLLAVGVCAMVNCMLCQQAEPGGARVPLSVSLDLGSGLSGERLEEFPEALLIISTQSTASTSSPTAHPPSLPWLQDQILS